MTTPDVLIEYVGPGEQDSYRFGVLVPGQCYQCEPEFADYLCRQHPDYWRRPAVAKAPPPPPEE